MYQICCKSKSKSRYFAIINSTNVILEMEKKKILQMTPESGRARMKTDYHRAWEKSCHNLHSS